MLRRRGHFAQFLAKILLDLLRSHIDHISSVLLRVLVATIFGRLFEHDEVRAARTLVLDFDAGLGLVEFRTVLIASCAVHRTNFDRRVHLLVFLRQWPIRLNLIAAFELAETATQC